MYSIKACFIKMRHMKVHNKVSTRDLWIELEAKEDRDQPVVNLMLQEEGMQELLNNRRHFLNLEFLRMHHQFIRALAITI